MLNYPKIQHKLIYELWSFFDEHTSKSDAKILLELQHYIETTLSKFEKPFI